MPVSDQQFAHSKHRYTHPATGERMISVTSVLGNYADSGKVDRMCAAAVKIGPAYRSQWNAKADLGRRVHEHASSWALGKAVDVLEGDDPYVDALAGFCQAKHPEWVVTEEAVVSSLGYGGRMDAIAYFDNAFWLLDFKCGRQYHTELELQLSAYRWAEGLIQYNALGKAVSLAPMPHVDRCAGLYLSEDGSAQLVEVKADREAFEIFCSLLKVRQFFDARKAAQ